jgi:GntR family transcriptional regulator, transcriptional repressor for pyruvate dehydrogenase complex
VNLSDSFTASLPDTGTAARAHAEAKEQREETALPLSPISRRSAADEVRAQLLAMIESGVLKVNGRLPSEAELAQRFGVSRPVIREALRGLQVLGFTESRTGRGTFVASKVAKLTLSFGQYSPADLNEVRRCIEVPAASLAARRRTQADIDEMRRILDAHEHVTDTDEAVRLDGQFHCAIARATGNMLFLRLIEDLREILQEQSLAVSALPHRHEGAASEHRAVFDAIVRGDSDGAAEAVASHLGAVEVAVTQLTRERDAGE